MNKHNPAAMVNVPGGIMRKIIGSVRYKRIFHKAEPTYSIRTQPRHRPQPNLMATMLRALRGGF